MSSCSDEVVNDSRPDIFKDPEAYIRKKTVDWELKGISDDFETYTLEEINEVMRRNGLEEISKEEVDEAKKLYQLESRNCTWPCATWHALGDNTGDGLLKLADYVALRSELCRLGGTQGYCLDGYSNLNNCVGSYCPRTEFINNCAMSYLGPFNNGLYELSGSDHLAMQQRLLGIICCN
jgi:hypothetical protein